MEINVSFQLNALSHPQRLALFRLLMRRYPGEMRSGDLARAMSFKFNTTSVYLSSLKDAGLITQRREGTALFYRANLSNAESLMQYLFSDCLRGRPVLTNEDASRPLQRGAPAKDRKYNVLFVCTGNSARSIFAEAILRHEASGKFDAYSAGARPYGSVHRHALEILNRRGLDTSDLYSKNISEFQGEDALVFDFIFTVCDMAANEECPTWPGQPISSHWGLPDPVKATGNEAERRLAFHHTFGAMENRIKAFAALPFETLDRASLQHHVDDIGTDRR